MKRFIAYSKALRRVLNDQPKKFIRKEVRAALAAYGQYYLFN